MKTATFLILAFLLAGIQAVEACPVYETLRIRILNQEGPLYSAKVRLKRKNVDYAYELHHADRFDYKDGKRMYFEDSSEFSVYDRRYNGEVNLADYVLEISAPGYATVLIDGVTVKIVEVQVENSRYTRFKLSLLEVVLYAKQGMKVNNDYVVFEQFQVKDLKYTDSTRLDLEFYKKEVRNQEWTASPGAEQTLVSVKAFPNPVKDNLHIRLSYFPLAAHRIELHDANGKLVDKKEFQMEAYDLTMGWYTPGTYFLTIYDPSNTVVLRQQIVHQ